MISIGLEHREGLSAITFFSVTNFTENNVRSRGIFFLNSIKYQDRKDRPHGFKSINLLIKLYKLRLTQGERKINMLGTLGLGGCPAKCAMP